MEGDLPLRSDLGFHRHFNPLPPHGGRPRYGFRFDPPFGISIHSLRMEGDPNLLTQSHSWNNISIHSLRMEGDLLIQTGDLPTKYFNPLPPHGGRPVTNPFLLAENVFQSTPSAWRETNCYIDQACTARNFNPLPPHGGRPGATVKIIAVNKKFQSTPSAWRETADCVIIESQSRTFQSTPSAWRETRNYAWHGYASGNFNPLPPHGGRPPGNCLLPQHIQFQSTPSAWRETRF